MFTLYLDVSDTQLLMSTHLKSKLQNHELVSLEPDTSPEEITKRIRQYLKNKFITSCVLIIHENPPFQFVKVPVNLSEKDIRAMLQINYNTYFSGDVDTHTTDYIQMDTAEQLLVYSIPNQTLDRYIKLIKPLRIAIKKIELYQNVLINHLGSQDKGLIMVGVSHGQNMNIYVLEGGALKQVIEWDGTDFEKMIAPYVDLSDKPLIERAYFSADTDEAVLNLFKKQNIERQIIENIYTALEVTK